MNGERVMSPGERAAYANGWQARDAEVEELRAVLYKLYKLLPRPWMDGKIKYLEWDAAMTEVENVLLSKSKEAT